jgi:catechol 2,3-dioxygenase-like lactoylglutathione lyase family enzyme
MNITKLQFVTVPVADHVRAKDFYVNTLGFDLVVDRQGPHGRFVMVAPKGAQSGLVLVDFDVDGRDFGGPVHLQFHTGDVDQDVENLRANGIEAADPQDLPWGRATSFKDTDGHTIALLAPSAMGAFPAGQ